MILYKNPKSFRIQNIYEIEKSVSTLLVPEHLHKELISKKNLHGKKLSGYLKFLLRTYRVIILSGMIPQPRKIKTEYQNTGLNLKPVSFRPGNADWLELGELAIAFGKSRCYIFTFLLELDILGFGESIYKSGLSELATTKNNLQLRASVLLDRIFEDFARIFHVRI